MKSLHKLALILLMSCLTLSCGKQDPQGVFSGEIKDWVHEVFTGPIVSGGKEGKIILTLRQTPDGSTAEMVFEHPQIDPVKELESGKLEMAREKFVSMMEGNHPSIF